MPENDVHSPSETHFETGDGVTIHGRLWEPAVAKPRAAVLIAGATGVRQHLYAGFAAALADQNMAVLTFDFRGIGDSRGEQSLRHCPARKQDWGELDMPAALAWLDDRYPTLPIHLVGHSAGAQLVGLMPNHARFNRIVTVAASSGYLGGLRGAYRYFARVVMGAYFPLAIRACGYLPAKRIGMGEDLPAGVARQWAAWCSRPGYVANDFGKGIRQHHYDAISQPILALAAADDLIATEANIADFFRLLPNADIEHRRLDPAALGTGPIGHINFFRRRNRAQWPIAIDWLCRG